LRNSFERGNPLVGLTAAAYKDFASALVRYVALNGAVDQTTYSMNPCRDYSHEIAGKVAVATNVNRQWVSVLAKSERQH